MIDVFAEMRSVRQSTRIISAQLFDLADRGRFGRHRFQHQLDEMKQQLSLVFKRRLEWRFTAHNGRNLSEKPRVVHRTAADMNRIATCFAKSLQCCFYVSDVAAA